MLKGNCNLKTIVGCNYEEIIISIHDHYKDVLSRALTDEPKMLNFATNDNPQSGAINLRTIQGSKRNVKKGVSQNMSLA